MNIASARLALLSAILYGATCAGEFGRGTPADSYGTSLRAFALILSELTAPGTTIDVLVSDTQSPHDFHPKPSDIGSIVSSRAVFLGAPELDGWAEQMTDLDVYYLSDLLDSTAWLYTAGSRNPHFWTDPVLVRGILPALADELCHIDEVRCPTYRTRADSFAVELVDLEAELAESMRPLSGSCLFSAQPFFDYFLARFQLASAGTLESVPGQEPSAAHVVDMIQLSGSTRCIGIIAQRRLPDAAARLFSQETELRVVYLDPIGDARDHSYAELLRRNAELIRSLRKSPP